MSSAGLFQQQHDNGTSRPEGVMARLATTGRPPVTPIGDGRATPQPLRKEGMAMTIVEPVRT